VRSEELYIDHHDGGNPRELIQALEGLLDEVPAEHRGNVVLEVDDGEYSCSLQLVHTRPETDEEMSTRLVREQNSQAYNDERDRLQYEALKQRFEPTT
jgi:hypothetical protein